MAAGLLLLLLIEALAAALSMCDCSAKHLLDIAQQTCLPVLQCVTLNSTQVDVCWFG
jgi:hypothetical protein